MKELQPRYSGPKSLKFWKKIEEVEDPDLHAMLYLAGCALQDHEARLLKMIKDVESR
jgi:hypothetical protein